MAEDLGSTSKVLHRRLKCYNCDNRLEVGYVHWFRCPDDHLICEECREECEKCDCGLKISKKHCLMTEELLKSKDMKFICTNERSGCTETLGEKDMIYHQKECIYR